MLKDIIGLGGALQSSAALLVVAALLLWVLRIPRSLAPSFRLKPEPLDAQG
jgi:hypothetical protein